MSVPREPLSPIWLISGSNTVHPRNPNWLIHPAHVSLIHTISWFRHTTGIIFQLPDLNFMWFPGTPEPWTDFLWPEGFCGSSCAQSAIQNEGYNTALQAGIPRSQTDGTSFCTKRTREENFLSKEQLGRNAFYGLGLVFLAPSAVRNGLISIEENGSCSHVGKAPMLKENSFEAGENFFITKC